MVVKTTEQAAEIATTAPAIYMAMVHVGAELAKVGIAKDRKNEQQNFRFRGIDEVMSVVSPILWRHDIVFLVDYSERHEEARVTAKGATLYHASVKGAYTFVSAKDASAVTVTTFGEAMDSGDKAMNKAMSAALKYALLQTFLVPTEGDNDADATTQEPSIEKPPAGFEDWFTEIVGVADTGFDPIREAWKASREDYRAYAMKYRASEWDAAKKHATAVTKKQKAAEK